MKCGNALTVEGAGATATPAVKAPTKLAKKCQGQGSNREARCADRLLNEIRNIAFAGRVDNDVGPSHSTI